MPTTIEPGTYDVPGGQCYNKFSLAVHGVAVMTDAVTGDKSWFRPDSEWLTWAASELAAGRFVKVEE